MSAHHSYANLVDDTDGITGAGSTSAVSLGTEVGFTGNTLNLAMYLKEPGSAMAVSMGDIHQGAAGDCFLLSALSEIARQSVIQHNPNFIPSMIHINPNGTETVRLYAPAATTGAPWTPISETVTNVFGYGTVNYGPLDDVVGNQKEIWPQVIESAYAQAHGGMDAISNGGYAAVAMEALTGKQADAIPSQSLTLASLRSMTDNNDLIVFDTLNSDALPYHLVGNHSYGFAGYVGSGPNTAVQLYNPWGYWQPDPIPVGAISSSAAGIFQVDMGHFGAGAGHATGPAV
jgi:hypothetical protein